MRQECIEVVIHRTSKRHVELFGDLSPTRISRGKLSNIRGSNGFCIERENHIGSDNFKSQGLSRLFANRPSAIPPPVSRHR
jgi:hypothetical protein